MSKANNILGSVLLVATLACSGSAGGTATAPPVPPLDPNTPTDANGYVYKTVKIGQQTWLAENLRATKDTNGQTIPGVYAYNNQEANVAPHGRLYTWEAARKTIIAGWHLPTYEDWSTLIQTVGNEQSAQSLLQGGASGFNATYGGYRDYWGGFHELGTWSAYWSSTLMQDAPDHAHVVRLYGDKHAAEREGVGITGALSVRLVKD